MGFLLGGMDFRHAAQHFDDNPEDAVQDDNANEDE
jgi:hypothetical protein